MTKAETGGLHQPLADAARITLALRALFDGGHEHGTRDVEVPAERVRSLDQSRPVFYVARDELLEADGLEATIGFGDGPAWTCRSAVTVAAQR